VVNIIGVKPSMKGWRNINGIDPMMKGWRIIVVEIVGKEVVVNIIGKLSMKGWRINSVVEISGKGVSVKCIV